MHTLPITFQRPVFAQVVSAVLLASAWATQGALAQGLPLESGTATATALEKTVIAQDTRHFSGNYTVTLRQLGALFPLQLRGIDGTSGVEFSVRADEVVAAAKLHLNYAYSPALLPEISHLRVLVNEQVVATIAVPQENGGKNLQQVIDIPPRLIGEFNRLNIQLIGHYTLDCEDPAHTSLWANVGNDSVLELAVSPLVLANDLAFLPEPFFDRRDVRPLNLPFVFAHTPDAGQLEAAGTMASWFGALAGFRGATFPAVIGTLPPQGHAIILALQGSTLPGVTLPAMGAGATVTVATHPLDPAAKLLIISGRDTQELKRAVAALAVGASALSGPTAAITDVQQVVPRKPYDAPHWLSTERPVKFGELQDASLLGVSGYYPDLIRINFQVPPDLFGWRKEGIPMHLKYRYSGRPEADKSTLNINANGQFLRSLPLQAANHNAPTRLDRMLGKIFPLGDLLPAQEHLNIPLFKLPARSQLQFHYYHEIKKEGACKDVLLDNVRGTIEPDSTIDITGFEHFLAMPDLAAFGNSGFPFTRLADLSETAVVLPAQPALEDYAAYLALMGLMGNATGYPGHAVTVVTQGQALDTVADKDLLVIASSAQSPLLEQWADHLPFSLKDQTKGMRVSDYASRLLRWWDPDQRDRARPGQTALTFTSASVDAVIAGFESPLKNGRSVVLLASNQAAGLKQAVQALLTPDLLQHIQGSTAVVHGKQVDSLVAEQTYYVGHLGPVTWARWWLSRSPMALIFLGVAAALLIAFMLYVVLRARARTRLQVGG